MPLTQDRRGSIKLADNKNYADPVAANTVIYAGAIYCLNAAGDAVPASATATLKVRGRCTCMVDNTGGASGAQTVNGEKGVFSMKNSAGGDEITRADIEGTAYLVDDETVAKTNGGGTRPVAGKIVDIDGQVFIEIS